MNGIFNNRANGYSESIRRGLSAVRSFGCSMSSGTGSREENLSRLKQELETADAIVIGAGAGLSSSAGLTYSGERFRWYFFDFIERFGFPDMYSGGFWPFPDNETRWAWWARHIYFNRYIDPPKPVYNELLALVKDKDYFVITTNVDHQFQRAGFDKSRLFYTQGDYGLFQDAQGRGSRTWDNEDWVMLAMEAQGFVRDENGVFQVPKDRRISMRLPHDLIPTDPKTGLAVAMNLRADDTFVEDAGWYSASANYAAFLMAHESQHILYLELGVGSNTPVIIKYPFWAMTADNSKAVYACLNYSEAVCPKVIEDRSICIGGDIGEVLKRLL
ncbi:MAG: hypothetical protein IJH47_08120 [Oscillospiraceae bacterium]|nr:hypothetical protein [Oscillospiraceae bacterium]